MHRLSGGEYFAPGPFVCTPLTLSTPLLLYCSCDLTIWSLHPHRKTQTFGVSYSRQYFYSSGQWSALPRRSDDQHCQEDNVQAVWSSLLVEVGLVFKTCVPPTHQCWSNQWQEAVSYLSTTLYQNHSGGKAIKCNAMLSNQCIVVQNAMWQSGSVLLHGNSDKGNTILCAKDWVS